MAMAGLGLGTHLSAIRRAGLKPLLLAALLFAWLVLGGGFSPAWRSPESSARKPCTARRKASCRASTSSMPWPRRQPWTSPLPG